MEIVLTAFEQNENLFIVNIGCEEISENAHWGRGSRGFFILHYVLGGEGYFNSRPVKAGEGFLIYPGSIHEYHSSKKNPWKYFWIIFGGKEAENIAKTYVTSNIDGIFEFDLSAEFFDFVSGILANDAPLGKARALGYFYTTLAFHEKVQHGAENKYVEEAKRIMNSQLDIGIRHLAAKLGINDRYLYNLFIKHEGISPKQYLNELKYRRACAMLSVTKYSISEIARACGFTDVLAFSKFFSKHTGSSATKYRKGTV